MSIRSGPAPKLASTAGAYTEPSRLPNWARTAAVATMIWDRSGLVVCGPSRYRRLAGTPCALSAWHMTGSQATTAVRLTWPATQAAARLRTAAPAPRACGPRPSRARAWSCQTAPARSRPPRPGPPRRESRQRCGRAAGPPWPLSGRGPRAAAPRYRRPGHCPGPSRPDRRSCRSGAQEGTLRRRRAPAPGPPRPRRSAGVRTGPRPHSAGGPARHRGRCLRRCAVRRRGGSAAAARPRCRPASWGPAPAPRPMARLRCALSGGAFQVAPFLPTGCPAAPVRRLPVVRP